MHVTVIELFFPFEPFPVRLLMVTEGIRHVSLFLLTREF